MPIREFPKSDNKEEHQEYITSCIDDDLDEYILHISATPSFYRMAVAERNKRTIASNRKPHWSKNPIIVFPVLLLLLTASIEYQVLTEFLESLFHKLLNLF